MLFQDKTPIETIKSQLEIEVLIDLAFVLH
jgi:hypothetical protein